MSTIVLYNVGVYVAKIVEPPVLMSRVLAFVLATSAVVLAALLITLFKMIPLERPEVFFLFTPTRSTNVVIEPLSLDADDKKAIENYQEGFIREYVIARNTLYTNTTLTRNNWAKVVKPWSSAKVFNALSKTALYQSYNFDEQPTIISCTVNFSTNSRDRAIIRTKNYSANNNEYTVNFTWICENIGGQTTQKNYKIQIKVQSDLNKNASEVLTNLEKLNVNPLGIQVTEYKVLSANGDPLNSDVKSW